MPRTYRITWLNYPHLVIAQANGGSSLFIDDADYQFYVAVLRQMARDRLLKVFAYCLMEHEIRLVIEPMRLTLSRIMQRLHGRHTSRMNNKQKRVGHLFRERFRSIVFHENDLLDVVRSVHLWPVRQGILRRPELYPYSSHASYATQGFIKADFVHTSQVLGFFNGDLEAKRRAFVRYVELVALEHDDFGIDEIVPGIGGSKPSVEELLEKAKIKLHRSKKSSVKFLADRVSLLLSISPEQLLGLCRRQDLVMARRLLATAAVIGAERSVTEVAHYLRRDKAQVSRLVTQGMDLLENNEAFSLMFESLKAKGSVQPERETTKGIDFLYQ